MFYKVEIFHLKFLTHSIFSPQIKIDSKKEQLISIVNSQLIKKKVIIAMLPQNNEFPNERC